MRDRTKIIDTLVDAYIENGSATYDYTRIRMSPVLKLEYECSRTLRVRTRST